MAIGLELTINDTTDQGGRYLTWAATPCQLRVSAPDGAVQPIPVTISTGAGSRGRLEFRMSRDGQAAGQLRAELPVDGEAVAFFVSGRFGSPSVDDGDTHIEIRNRDTGAVLSSVPVMVRIRKNANLLRPAERDRFLSAIARLNNQGQGLYQNYRDTHVDNTRLEAHGRHGFLPWHRAYLLDLERELQRIDPAVTIPYWRFDQPAPNVFTAAFLGTTGTSGFARFLPSNPLRVWTTDGQIGILRRPFFEPGTSAAHDDNGQRVRREAVIVGFRGPFSTLTGPFESNPHGSAHDSFSGHVSAIGSAVRDPLFFLLHCNVDRLWAKWQWFNRRFDPQDPGTYQFNGAAGTANATRIGHNLRDTMWPWNGDTRNPRPATAPRTPFPDSPVTHLPGPAPTVGSMIDFQGLGPDAHHLGFDYDDVPYQPE
ncbi:tyrosinase family protein [Actinoplanes sp. NPDC024001]|uniref:tyrosinase family protein n=1 Tax=Actinoplanes sp. NPDC024001 TaxID=3154598 RepID=UPI0033DB28F4